MQERRKDQRWPTYLGGQVSFAQQHSSADCLIRNASVSGARLVVRQARFIPDRFELAIPQQDKVYRAHVRWRGRDEFGVELDLTSAEKDAPVPLSLMRRLKRAESENSKLKRRVAELSQ